jgi:hypothetical protein
MILNYDHLGLALDLSFTTFSKCYIFDRIKQHCISMGDLNRHEISAYLNDGGYLSLLNINTFMIHPDRAF